MNVEIYYRKTMETRAIASLPKGWTMARLRAGLQPHLGARRIAKGEVANGPRLSADRLVVGEVFG